MKTSKTPDIPRVETVQVGEPCRIWIRPSWPLCAMGLVVAWDAGAVAAGGRSRLSGVPGWSTVRALLLHGVALRDRLAAAPAPRVDVLRSPEAVGQWIADQGSDWWHRLLGEAAVQGWEYALRQMPGPQQMPVRGWLRARVDRPAWWRDAGVRLEVVAGQAEFWQVSADGLAPYLADPGPCMEAIVGVLEQVRRDADRGADPARVYRGVAPDGRQALEQVTGRPVMGALAADVIQIRELVVVPTPGLNQDLPVARQGHRWTVWAELDAAVGANGRAPVRAEPLLLALGDPLSLRIIGAVAAAGSAYALQLSEQLAAHPSTLSRHLNQLADAGWLHASPEGHRVVYRLSGEAVQAVTTWLTDLARRPHTPS